MSGPTEMARRPARAHLILHLGRPLLWEVSDDGIVELQSFPTDVGQVFSFDPGDLRLVVERPLGTQAAKQMFVREHGEDVRVVNRSRALRRIYGRPLERFAGHGYAILPGALALDLLLAERGAKGGPCVAGFVLGGAGPGARRLALLYAFDELGNVLRFQPAINPDDLPFVVEELARSTGIDCRFDQALLFSQSDLFGVRRQLDHYPVEDEWNGIALRHLRRFATALVGLTVLACLGRAGFDGLAAVAAAHSAMRLGEQERSLAGHAERVLVERLGAFAERMSIHPVELLDAAEAVWRPGTRVTLSADPQRSALTVAIDAEVLHKGALARRFDAVPTVRPAAMLDAVLEGRPIPGWVVVDRIAVGDGNGFQVRYERRAPDDPLGRLARH